MHFSGPYYDANGNILSQKRNGNATQTNMDDLRYFYKAYDVSNGNTQVIYTVNNQTGDIENASGLPYASGQLELTNQLSYVSDNTTYANNYTDDIDNQNNSFNYQYDEIGNLTKDLSEEIDKIEWTVYGKIKRITRTTTSNKPDLEFEYTPDGHRAVKIVIPKGSNMRTYTYYVRDAQGNIMATYSRNFQKTIDYANLTYAQVNTSLTNKTSAESFAWFMANAHSAGAPGFVAALKADILSSSANTDWFLNHTSFNPELVLNAESDLGNRVWFNYDRQVLVETLRNTGQLDFVRICNCMKNRKLENEAPNYKSFIEHVFLNHNLLMAYMEYIYNVQPTYYSSLLTNMNITPSDFSTDMTSLTDLISTLDLTELNALITSTPGYTECPDHMAGFQDYLITVWSNEIKEELALIEDFNEIFQNTSLDNFEFNCEEMGLPYLFSLLNSQNTTTLRSTMIDQVQGSGITTEQQKKTWLINWYFANDPMGSIYLATLRNPALVASYQTSPGMLYGANGAAGMETYFIKIRNHFGQSMFDQLVTEFAQQSNLYVDEIKVDEWHLYGSSRLGVYEANRLISKRVARDLNLDNQITKNEYVIETPEEVTYLFSSYQLERGAKRYELANHLGNVLTVISDKKTANFTGSTFSYFSAERISATDYSPFGAPLAGRTWNGGEYRVSFNGKEKDDEVSGAGNSIAFELRIYDSRLCRFNSIDPREREYPWQSTYAYLNNCPISIIDFMGGGEPPNEEEVNFGMMDDGKKQKSLYDLLDPATDPVESQPAPTLPQLDPCVSNPEILSNSMAPNGIAIPTPTNPFKLKLKEIGDAYYANLDYKESILSEGHLRTITISSINIMVTARKYDENGYIGKRTEFSTKVLLAYTLTMARQSMGQAYINGAITTSEEINSHLMFVLNSLLRVQFGGDSNAKIGPPFNGVPTTKLRDPL
ncbi:MAG: RHS repeat-associated core domain-containing protein [Bacteroidia bacterium]